MARTSKKNKPLGRPVSSKQTTSKGQFTQSTGLHISKTYTSQYVDKEVEVDNKQKRRSNKRAGKRVTKQAKETDFAALNASSDNKQSIAIKDTGLQMQVVVPTTPQRDGLQLLLAAKILADGVRALNTVTNTREITNILSRAGLQEIEEINSLENSCYEIATILRNRRSQEGVIPKSIDSDLHVVRTPDKSIKLLSVMESFRSNARVSPKKTFGLIRRI
jgi:hypothetical protein